MSLFARSLPLALALAVFLVIPAQAEEPPEPAPPPGEEPAETFPEKAPPRLERSPADYQKSVERPDLIEYIKTLRRALAQYEKPAPRTETVTALHDAWSKILKPRARRMTTRLEKWENRKRWLYPDGESKPIGLQPDQWTQFTRDMASLGTELHGAWKQYGSVKLREKGTAFGQATVSRPMRVSQFGYGRPALYGGVRGRQLAGRGIGRWDMGSYWHLLNSFNAAWNWRFSRRAEYDRFWRKQAKVRKQTFQDLRTDLENTRESLGENMLGLQALVGALQNAEEERLARGFHVLPEDDTLREMVEPGLKDMEQARLDAEGYEGKSSAAYGTLLRNWLRIQKAGVKLLEAATSEVEKAGAAEAPEKEKAGEDPADESARDER